jgi:hypothetical protein
MGGEKCLEPKQTSAHDGSGDCEKKATYPSLRQQALFASTSSKFSKIFSF